MRRNNNETATYCKIYSILFTISLRLQLVLHLLVHYEGWQRYLLVWKYAIRV